MYRVFKVILQQLYNVKMTVGHLIHTKYERKEKSTDRWVIGKSMTEEKNNNVQSKVIGARKLTDEEIILMKKSLNPPSEMGDQAKP